MILAAIIKGMVSLGLSQGLAKKAAPWVLGAGIALLALLLGLWALNSYVAGEIKDDRLEGNNTALTNQLEAAEQSAREALENQATNAATVEAYNDAIENPQPGDSADPDVRLACEQLRRAGEDTTAIPECGNR